MPPQLPAPRKPYFFYGHKTPSQNRPTVYGGLFSNRQTIDPKDPNYSLNPRDLKVQKSKNPKFADNFKLKNWDPDSISTHKLHPSPNPSEKFFLTVQNLSPLARFICDSIRKHKRWGPPIIEDLCKLRRVTPFLVAEVLKVQSDPVVASRFFHWAGKQKGYQHNYASYNAFAYCLNRLNKFRAADQVPELMHMQGRPPSEKQFEILIRMHADNGRGLRVHYVYEKMKKFGVKPRVFLYNRIMEALVKTDHLDLALSVYKDFKDDGLVEESVTYMILIKGLCKGGRVDEMLEILNKMRLNCCKPDVFAYTAMIRVLVEEGNLHGCLKVWEEMLGDDVAPDVMAYSTLITALCKGNAVEKAYVYFKEMKRKGYLIDRAIYGSLVEAFVADGKVGEAIDLWTDLLNSGYRADLSIYNPLIEGLCDVDQIDKARQLFEAAVQESLQPDFVTLKPILMSYAELRNMDEFVVLLKQMQRIGLSVMDDLSKLFSIMIEDNKLAVALELHMNLKQRGYCSVLIYNILMGDLYRRGKADKALLLFDDMKESSEIFPDSTMYSHVITCLVELEEIEEACLYHNKIKEMSGCPSVSAYCSLVKGLCEIGEIDSAILLVRDCLANVVSGPNEFMYCLTILDVCKKSNNDMSGRVLEVIDEMVEQDCSPDVIICCAIISGMCKYGTVEEARKVFSDMKKRGVLNDADVIVYDERLIEHMKRKTADLVRSGLKFFGLERKLKSKGCNLLSC